MYLLPELAEAKAANAAKTSNQRFICKFIDTVIEKAHLSVIFLLSFFLMLLNFHVDIKR